MTSQHDTPEAVEQMARMLDLDAPTRSHIEALAAAMLRRLHARAVEAEQAKRQALDLAERHMNEKHKARREAKEDWQMLQSRVANLEAALATARADALREAAAYCHSRTTSRSYGSWADAFEAAERGILALTEKEPRA